MFENLVESTTKSGELRKRLYYFLTTSIVWSLAVAGLIIGGIYSYNSKLEGDYKLLARIAPPLPPLAPAPPPPPGRPRAESPKPQQPVKQRLALVAPRETPPVMSVREAPKQIEMPKQAELPAALPDSRRDNGSAGLAGGIEGGVEGGVAGGTLGAKLGGSPNGIIGGTERAAPPPPPPPPKVEEPKPEPTPSIVQRSEGVIRGNAISKPVPAYPPAARTAHITGDVRIAIIIGEDGEIVSANVISGPDLLKAAALEAARGWKFKPTLVNKTPVKVEGIITFRFTM